MKIAAILTITIGFFLTATSAYAHVVVKPSEVGVAAFQSFTVGVPVEKDIPTTEIRLVVPDGLEYVTPNVKTGWEINVSKEGEGDEAKVTEITWTGGSIPAGQRDEFVFSAQVPSRESTLAWKAYQTYEDGEVVNWDASPKTVEEYEKKNGSAHGDENAPKPYSETVIKNDLGTADNHHTEGVQDKKGENAFLLSILAIAMSATALGLQFYKKK